MTIDPMPGYIVVRPEEAANKTASGLYIPESSKEKPKTAIVEAVGEGVVEVKKGDRIVYKNEYEATTIKEGKDEFTIVFIKNIIAKVSK